MLSLYRALVEHAPTMAWRSGLDLGRDHFNPAWRAFTGRTLAQEVGSGWVEGVHPDDLDACLATWREAFERRAPFESACRLRRHDGVYRSVMDRGTPYSDERGAFVGFIGICTEIDAPEHARSYADDLFEMSIDNVCAAGFDGYFKRLNPSWTRTLGWTVDELMSKPLIEFVHPDDREAVLTARAGLMKGEQLHSQINRYLCSDGSYRWFQWKSVSRPDRGLVYAVARDITEQKRAEERLQEAKELQEKLQRQLLFADRMASVGTLAAGVAHEINNPLAFIMANVGLLIEEIQALSATVPSPHLATLGELAAETHTGAERIEKIVRGLKTFSRAEDNRRAVIALQPLLDVSINMTRNEIHQRGARLVEEYGDLPLVEVDEARLGQVFVNLLINAAQALPERKGAEHEIRVTTYTDAAGRAVITFRDTGCGIPAASLERIFDPFFTTKPVGVGTGLGLSISHTIVSDIGGELQVESEEGCGTTFRVVLPPAAQPREQAVALPLPSAQATPGALVLVVDDEPAMGAALRRILRGHDVSTVTSGSQALELLAGGKRFDVIFSDLMMPEMSGMELFDELTQRFPDAAERVVFISGGAFTPGAAAFLDRVPNRRLEKPFEARALRALVQGSVG